MRYTLTRWIPAGSFVLGATTLGSYAMGLVRDRTFAHIFGLSTSLDAYNAAFLLPDFLFNLLVASGIAAAGVPLFISARKESEQAAHTYVNALLATATAVMLVTGIGIFILAPVLAQLITPGFEAEAQAQVAKLMRVLAVSPIIFAVSNALGAMLVAQRRYLFYGLSPIFYNAGIIAGAWFLAPRFGVMGLAYGTLAGAGLHALVRVIDGVRSGWSLGSWTGWPAERMKRTLKLMLPKMFGHPVELVTFWVFTSMASLLAPGSIAALNFARNFQSVPVGVLGIAMATAIFPALSEAALKSTRELKAIFLRTALAILGVSGLAGLVTFAIRKPLVQILLGGGAFDAEAVTRTAGLLGMFCLSIPTESLSHLTARAFYARQNTIIPVLFSVTSLLIAGASAYLLLPSLGLTALPLGFFLGSLVKAMGLYGVFMSRKH